MVNITVGHTLNIGVAIYDFCGQSNNFIYIDNIGLGVDTPASVSIDPYVGCLNISNIGIEIKLAKVSGSAQCNQCAPDILFTSLGTVYTNSQGVASKSHVITNTDLSYYEQAIAAGGSLKIIACITNSQGQPIANAGACSTSIVIATDLCSGVTCNNTCIGLDLYSQICNPSTGQCVQNTLLESNSSQCLTPTDYIAYDFSFLPTEFLNLVSDSITNISSVLGENLPFPSNIQYVRSEYISGELRLYVIYTPPVLSGLSEFYNSPDRISDLAKNLSIISLIELSLDNVSRLMSGLIIFATCQILLVEVVGIGAIASFFIAAIGAVAVDFVIHNIDLSSDTPGSNNVPPDQQIEIIRNFANQVRIRCALLHPGCGDTPPTCDSTNMKSYNKCIGSLDIEQFINDGKQAGTLDQTKVDELIARVNAIDACLTAGTCTAEQAKTDIDNRSADVNDNSQQKQQDTTCETGFTYDSDKKKCVAVENCLIRNPFGGCILSKETASGLLMFGGLIIGGYVIMSSGSGHKGGSTEHVVTIREQIQQAKERETTSKETKQDKVKK